ncbi:MAG TPA: LOG family protein, partial [Verrucomicrobiae bacterium]|nr:LOG family protein [Verrucomicrobiae bacterium]
MGNPAQALFGALPGELFFAESIDVVRRWYSSSCFSQAGITDCDFPVNQWLSSQFGSGGAFLVSNSHPDILDRMNDNTKLTFTKEDPWRIFRIMAEFVDSFETLSQVGPGVTIFGSARTKPGDPAYKATVELAYALAKNKLSVITGGGPGIMEAANKGAAMAKGKSIGLNIQLPHEQRGNRYANIPMHFHYFFSRKVCFVKYSIAFVFM